MDGGSNGPLVIPSESMKLVTEETKWMFSFPMRKMITIG